MQTPRSVFLPFLLAASCSYASHEPVPLPAAAVVEAAARGREDVPWNEQAPLTLRGAAEWMREHGPALAPLLARFSTELAVARVPTPWPNPVLEAGPLYGFGDDVTSRSWQPFGGLKVPLPVGGRLATADEVNRMRAEHARVEAMSGWWGQLLELRDAWAALVLARQELGAQQDAGRAAEAAMATFEAMARAGTLGSVELGAARLELARIRLDELTAADRTAAAEQRLAALLGCSVAVLAHVDAALPARAGDPPPLAALRATLHERQPQLLRLQADYALAEAQLQHEMSLQYPDLVLGGSLQGDPGERKTVAGLTLGVDLPLFDRNQQGIARALERRETVRAEYEAAASLAVGELEAAHQGLARAEQAAGLAAAGLLPAAEQQLQATERAALAGLVDGRDVLLARAQLRQARIRVLQAQLAAQEAWVRLERAAGMPLRDMASIPKAPDLLMQGDGEVQDKDSLETTEVRG